MLLALAAGALAMSGCAAEKLPGSTSSAPSKASATALESSERSEVEASLGNEAAEQAKVRELLGKIEEKKQEEEAETAAKKTEAAAKAKAKRREKAEAAAKHKLAALEAALKKREAEASKREAAAKQVSKPAAKHSGHQTTTSRSSAPAPSIGAAPSVTVPSGSN